MKLPLTQGAYQARGVIANAQSCINLYAEPNTPDGPMPMSHYPAPGLTLFHDFSENGASGPLRGLYQASNGTVFLVAGTQVWALQGNPSSPTWIQQGNLPSNTGNPVIMCDNQTDVVLVDGSGNGWYIPLASSGTANAMVQINDPAFYGSNRVDFIDTFLIFNWGGTPTWYSTTSNVLLPFDGQYFAAKEGWNDLLVCVAALHDNVWVLGNETTEIWYNAGGALFPFARMPNSVLQQGCVACYSVVIADNAIYWLSQDRWGQKMLIRGEGYAARRVSTFAVEQIWNTYAYVDDCIGMAYQIGGHETIGLYFPSAQAWWAYDASTQQWHQRTYNGTTAPWLAYCMCFWGHVFGQTGDPNTVLVGGNRGPQLYILSRGAYTDAGVPITRQRSWMHITNEGHRQVHTRFQAYFSGPGLTAGQGIYPDGVTLTWSDDGGNSFGAGVEQTGQQQNNGSYLWRRLGYGRDRVYQVSWTAQGEATLNGAWIDVIPQMT